MARTRLWSGEWWRFNRYEIRNSSIRPVKNARLERYDPWELHRISSWDTGTSPPYQSLIALLLSLGAFFDDVRHTWRLVKGPDNGSSLCLADHWPGPSERDEILDWCNRFGLLGILPHSALTIGLPVRRGHHVPRGLYFRRCRVRLNGKWINEIEAFYTKIGATHPDALKDLKLMEEDDPVLGRFVRKTCPEYKTPTAVFSQETPGFSGEIPMPRVRPTFFPDSKGLQDQFECPLPLTPDFWKIYSEPVGWFLQHAIAFVAAVEPIAAHRSSASPAAMEWLLAPVGVSLSLSADGSIQEQWVCPSLLASFARMALQDVSAGKRLLRCECCGDPFVTLTGHQKHYCSKSCGWRHRKRRALKRKLEKGREE
jgi:hypothetical protein